MMRNSTVYHEEYSFPDCVYSNNLAGTHILQRVLRSCSPGDIVIDLGCGDGNLWRNGILDLIKIEYWGIDINAQAVDSARGALAGARLEAGDVTKACEIFGEEVANYVVSKSVLEHIYLASRDAFFRTGYELLKPGGRWFLSWDHGHFWKSKWVLMKQATSRLLHRLGYKKYMYACMEPLAIAENRAREAGFRVVDTSVYNTPTLKEVTKLIPTADVFRVWKQLEDLLNSRVSVRELENYLSSVYMELEKPDH